MADAFGGCCRGLAESMSGPPNSMFRVEENGVLYLTIGYAMTPQGPGWFDQAVMFCPFCGVRLQDEETVAARSMAGQKH